MTAVVVLVVGRKKRRPRQGERETADLVTLGLFFHTVLSSSLIKGERAIHFVMYEASEEGQHLDTLFSRERSLLVLPSQYSFRRAPNIQSTCY